MSGSLRLSSRSQYQGSGRAPNGEVTMNGRCSASGAPSAVDGAGAVMAGRLLSVSKAPSSTAEKGLSGRSYRDMAARVLQIGKPREGSDT